MRLLSYCGALAAGEFLASHVPYCADAWPVLAIAVLLIGLFGYGLNCRGWRHLLVLLLGACLYLHASVESEQKYREQPWLRGSERAHLSRENGNDIASRIRRDLGNRVGIGLASERETVSISRAILLGERKRMPRRIKRMFAESGTMHVFAISGLHVMAIADVLAIMMAFTFVPRRLSGILVLPLLWGYVGLIGFSPSAVRAAMMATFSCIAPVFWRRPNGLRSWALTFLIVHCVNPLVIVNVGSALSFIVMLAIVVSCECGRMITGWKQAIFVTCVAWAAGVPVAAHVFGCVTPGGLLANLVLISAAKLTVVTGAVGIVISYFSETVAAYVNNLSVIGIRLMLLTAEGVTKIPYSNIKTGCWSVYACAAWYAMFILLGWLAWRYYSIRRHML